MASGVAAVVPARYGSTRLPAKPLLRDTGRTLIEHVVERVRLATTIDRVIVATDDDRIVDACRSFGAEAVLTSPDCRSGTDRVAEVARGLSESVVLNVQGDEPDLDPGALDALARAMLADAAAPMGTLAVPLRDEAAYRKPERVKVVIDSAGNALYFSRSPIPWAAEGLPSALLHLGIYAFRRDALLRFSSLAPSALEATERLEQLRALENGIPIRVVVWNGPGWGGIDTLDDYRSFCRRHRERKGTA